MFTVNPMRKPLLVAAISGGVALALWAFSGAFVSAQAKECAGLYQAARTAADTVAVDTTVPSGTYKTREPRSCASYSKAARWFARK